MPENLSHKKGHMFDWPLVEEPKKTEDFVIRVSHKWVLKPF